MTRLAIDLAKSEAVNYESELASLRRGVEDLRREKLSALQLAGMCFFHLLWRLSCWFSDSLKAENEKLKLLRNETTDHDVLKRGFCLPVMMVFSEKKNW